MDYGRWICMMDNGLKSDILANGYKPPAKACCEQASIGVAGLCI